MQKYYVECLYNRHTGQKSGTRCFVVEADTSADAQTIARKFYLSDVKIINIDVKEIHDFYTAKKYANSN